MADTLEVNRGQTIDVIVTFNDDNGDPVDLTEYTLEVFDNDLFPALTLERYDDEAGQAQLSMPAEDWAPVGGDEPPQSGSCRLRAVHTESSFTYATPRLVIYVR